MHPPLTASDPHPGARPGPEGRQARQLRRATSPTSRRARSRRPTSRSSSSWRSARAATCAARSAGSRTIPRSPRTAATCPGRSSRGWTISSPRRSRSTRSDTARCSCTRSSRPLVTVLKNHGCRLSGDHERRADPAGRRRLARRDGYDQLTFSIDGATEETMDKLRGASLAKILHVLQLIHDEKERRKSEFPRIVVNFVAQNDNFRELPELARLLAPLGIYFLGVNPLHHFFEIGGSATRPYYEEFRLSKAPARGVRGGRAESARSCESRGNDASRTSSTRISSGRRQAPTEAAGVALHNRTLPEARAPPRRAEAAARVAKPWPRPQRPRGARRPGGPARAVAHVLPLPVDDPVPLGGGKGARLLLHVGPRRPRRVHRRGGNIGRPGTGRRSSRCASTSATAGCIRRAASACRTARTRCTPRR